ncbi:hypothetical protein DMA11_13950 [Marinilabiliaceae bacterium JC017]|nr:hypothetical protein DMA11_13950 [Marinilabiliaceae bacterium JC017]
MRDLVIFNDLIRRGTQMKLRLFFTFIILLPVSVIAQINIRHTVEWLPVQKNTIENTAGCLRISRQSLMDEATLLPLVLHNIPLTDISIPESVTITLTPTRTSPLTPEEAKIISAHRNNIPPQTSYHIVWEQQHPKLEIEVLPIIIDKAGNSAQKIEEYLLSIELTQTVQQLKSLKLTKNTYTSNSVLASGKWIKIKVDESGVYKIPYSILSGQGFSSPSSVKVFGNGGHMLPRNNGTPRFDDLKENAVWHHNNAIYFYAQGPTEWKYDPSKNMFIQQLHDYSDAAYYFITEDAGTGLKIKEKDTSHLTPNQFTTSFDGYQFHEIEKENLLKSGKKWYGESFNPTTQERSFSFSFPNIDNSQPIKIHNEVIARSNITTSFEFFHDSQGTAIQKITIPQVSYSDYTGNFARTGSGTSEFKAGGETVNLQCKYIPTSSTSRGWLDYICLNARQNLIFNKNQLPFRDKQTQGLYNITRFTVSNANSNLVVWDVTSHTQPEQLKYNLNGSNLEFISPTDQLREFIVFDTTDDIPTPKIMGDVANQNLHGLPNADYLIITYADFITEANRLALLHQTHNNLSSVIVTPQQIYNEFSSGQPDITALRDFVRLFYNRTPNQSQRPKYLLLFGDGSYDNRSYDSKNTNKILTFQSDNSLNQTSSYVSDDFYGLLDDHEGDNMQTGRLDIGIGRFPVNTIEEAQQAVDKTETYLTDLQKGDWKSLITFVGDDGDYNIHMDHADKLSQKVFKNHPSFDLNKIYFDAYPKVTTSGGARYPEVENLIDETINKGTLIFNYTGHGGEGGLSAERVITKESIQQWTNKNSLPLFITATCEFSRYDKKEETTAGEWVFLNPVGGGIGLFSTTRIVYSSLNYILNDNIYNHIFEKSDNGQFLALGEVIRRTKNESGTSINKLNFTLIGDPALQLAIPKKHINTTKINESLLFSKTDSHHLAPFTANTDTLKAMSEALIGGEILTSENDKDQNFKGTVNITVFDKPTTVTTLGNEGAQPFKYETFQNKIFIGQSVITDGEFETSFFVPKDIRYNVADARASYYGFTEEGEEAFGAINTLKVGGVTDNPPTDEEGPTLSIWLNNRSFTSGGTTGIRPLLIADIFDESGINTSGIGIGHDISLIIDNDRTQTLVLNNYFQSDLNSYQKGTLTFQLPVQTPGTHKLELKVWDNLNNSSTAVLLYSVNEAGELKVNNAKVYPNPISQNGSLLFSLEHDEPNALLSIDISTFDLSGRIINQEKKNTISNGTFTQPLEWAPRTASGALLQPGFYILRFIIEADTGKTTTISKKIMVVQ